MQGLVTAHLRSGLGGSLLGGCLGFTAGPGLGVTLDRERKIQGSAKRGW